MSHTELEHREHLTERVILKMTPRLKQRLYSKAAREGRTVSDITRAALVSAIGELSRKAVL